MRPAYDRQTMRVWMLLVILGSVLTVVGWLRWAHLLRLIQWAP